MSGSAPYVYQDVLDGLLALGPDTLLYLYDGTSLHVVIQPGIDLFVSGCMMGQLQGPRTSEHPVGGYNIAYPYCRTAIRYRMDDPRSNPQIGQLVALAPVVSIQLLLDGCDLGRITNLAVRIDPKQPKTCAAEIYPGYNPDEYFLVVERSQITLPARFYFIATNVTGISREFWIGLRSERDGLPSGTVV